MSMNTIARDPAREADRFRATQRAKPGFGNKALRATWNTAWLLLYRPSPRSFHGWRRMLLRIFGARIGRAAMPYPGARIWAPWNLVMADGSVMGDGVDCYTVDRIVLGRGAVVSQRAFLCSASHDFDRPGFALVSAPITIGANAWVAAESFVAPGVRIGDGAVVLARSVVVKDVPAASVVAGNPARVLRGRSDAALERGREEPQFGDAQ